MFWANDLILAFGITTVAIAIVVSLACYVWTVTTNNQPPWQRGTYHARFTAIRYSSDVAHRASGCEPAGPKYLPFCWPRSRRNALALFPRL